MDNRWSKSIAFLGLGVMGKLMAENLVNAGYNLVVYDIVEEKVNQLVKLGVNGAACPIDAVTGADIVIIMVPDSPEVEAIIFGSNGILEHLKAGSIVVDMSTISPKTCKNVATALKVRGVDFLDAPVTGGDKGAKEGTLSILVGGGEEIFNKCLPIFKVLGRQITYMGDTGSGQTAKICNQIIGALNLQAVCEGIILASKAGINVEKLIGAISGGAAGSFMLDYMSKRILAHDYSPGFKVKLEQKDLKNALQLADELNVPLPGTSLVHQLFRVREAADGADEGTQALFQVYQDLSDHTL